MAHSSNVFTLSAPGAFSLTRSSLIGSACIHLRSQAVVMAWKATSVDRGLSSTRRQPNIEHTEFMTKVFRVYDGRRERVRRVDVLFFILQYRRTGFFFGRAYHRASRERMLRKVI